MWKKFLAICFTMVALLASNVVPGIAQQEFRVGAWCIISNSPPGQPDPIYQINPPTGPWRIYDHERDKLLDIGFNYCTFKLCRVIVLGVMTTCQLPMIWPIK